MQMDAVKIIRSCEFNVQPGQFTLMGAIDRYGPITVGQAVDALGMSQPAVTRMVNGLVALELMESRADGDDRRQKFLHLTAKGKSEIARARIKIWPRLEKLLSDMTAELSGNFLEQIEGMEAMLEEYPLHQRFDQFGPESGTDLSIIEYDDSLASHFHHINAQWINAMFHMEVNDRDILENPGERIINAGGIILFVRSRQHGIVGTCALIKIADGVYELTKMGVLESVRGQKAGEFLLHHIIERARTMGMQKLYLLTNHKCAAAIHLYEKLGFRHSTAIMQDYGARYERCDVAMDYPF